MTKVTIVGRPNVGKSSLFNRLLQKRIAIVDRVSGVTRDRLYGEVDWGRKNFIIVDTGGIDLESAETLQKQVLKQIEISIKEADLIIFLTDVKEGIVPLDKEIGRILRKNGKEVIVAANKVDNRKNEAGVHTFSALGWSDIIGISATHGLGIHDLLDAVCKRVKNIPAKKQEAKGLKIAVIGKPNVGKSTLINTLVGEERVIVNEVPGTTRDSVDIKYERNGMDWLFIDTAGMRKKRKVRNPLEYYSVRRSFLSINRADIIILMIDGWEGIRRQDMQMLDHISDKGKPCVIAVNKWDLVKEVSEKEYRERIEKRIAQYWFVPSIFISSLKNEHIEKLLKKIENLDKQSKKKISTGLLNRFFKGLQEIRHTKLYYGTQTKVNPITFMLFVNKLPQASVSSYITNQLRKAFGFEVPIRLQFKQRKYVKK